MTSFYGAMKTGDTAAAMRLIAPDAVFLESGKLETRANRTRPTTCQRTSSSRAR